MKPPTSFLISAIALLSAATPTEASDPLNTGDRATLVRVIRWRPMAP
jgi:hypothetical protein